MKIKFSELEDEYRDGVHSDVHNDSDIISFYKGSIDSFDAISFDCDGIIIEGNLICKESTLEIEDQRSLIVTGDTELKNLYAGDCHFSFNKVTVHNLFADDGNNGTIYISELIAKFCIFNGHHHTEIYESNIDLAIGYIENPEYLSIKTYFDHSQLSNFLEKNHPDLFKSLFDPEDRYLDVDEAFIHSDKLLSILETVE